MFGVKVCHAVNLMHENNLIHTDVKPENILFVSSDSCEDKSANSCGGSSTWNTGMQSAVHDARVKLIDLGNAYADQEANVEHFSIVSTVNYRAPEVITGRTVSTPTVI